MSKYRITRYVDQLKPGDTVEDGSIDADVLSTYLTNGQAVKVKEDTPKPPARKRTTKKATK